MEKPETFKCHVCNKEFDQYGLELHFVTSHNLEEEEDIEKSNLVHDKNIKNKCKIFFPKKLPRSTCEKHS